MLEPGSLSIGGAPPRTLAFRLTLILFVVCACNAGAWLWALIAFRHDPVLLGLAVVVYGLGLRHAVDGDHIAAIDNVTRRLMHLGQKPVSVGFFFAMGHSSVVLIVTLVVAFLTHAFSGFQNFQALGGAISTAVSAVFLISVAVANLLVFRSIYLRYRRSRRAPESCNDNETPLESRGFMGRILGRLTGLITRSWQMFPLGFLFGLGFETATEVALFGLSAAQVGNGLPVGAVLVFPLLFAAAMSLLDTLDGIVMLGVYQWAFVQPRRKIYYNMAITLISALVALLIGGLQAASFLRSRWFETIDAWDPVGAMSEKMGLWGVLVFLLLTGSWLVSWLLQRRTGPRTGRRPRISGARLNFRASPSGSAGTYRRRRSA